MVEGGTKFEEGLKILGETQDPSAYCDLLQSVMIVAAIVIFLEKRNFKDCRRRIVVFAVPSG